MIKEKKLNGLNPVSRSISHISAIEGCLNYLDAKIEPELIYGITGYAFLMNIDPGICVSGPTNWRSECIADRLIDLGYSNTVVSSWQKEDANFAKMQENAKQLIIETIDKGFPCYGGDFGFPEYFTIHGYEEQGIIWKSQYTGEDEQRTKWEMLGGTDVKWLIIGNIKPAPELKNIERAIKKALTFATELTNSPNKYSHNGITGLGAYDACISYIKDGTWESNQYGHQDYNFNCWKECKYFAKPFLINASKNFNKSIEQLLLHAADEYGAVHSIFSNVCNIVDKIKSGTFAIQDRTEMVNALSMAKSAEEKGLKNIQKALESMQQN